MKPNMILLEDDPDQAETIGRQLRQAFPNFNLVECTTESELRSAIDGLEKGSLVFAVLDAMVPWALPSPDMTVPPPDVQKQGIRYAGKRCLGYIRQVLGDRVPTWIYTVLDRGAAGLDDSDQVNFIEKQPQNDELLNSIRSIVKR